MMGQNYEDRPEYWGYCKPLNCDSKTRGTVEQKVKDTIEPASSQGDFRFIDLFAGIGGFNLAMRSLGGVCVFTSEWDKYAAQTYAAWHGQGHIYEDDIRLLDYRTLIPEHDILLAGFPCQPFSIAGVSKKNSLGRAHGFDDVKQGNLFFSICEIAALKKPPVMILENVKNLKSHDKGNTWKVISETLEALGYEVRSQIIDAKHWVPQHRERVFIVCFDRNQFLPEEIEQFHFPIPPVNGPRLGSILEAEPDQKYMLTDNLWKYLQDYAAKHRAKGNGFGFQLVGPDRISRTMSARYYKDGSEILIDQPGWKNPRRLTPSEAAKLMGFDESFARICGFTNGFPQVVSDTQAYKQFGNSVSPMVVASLGVQVLKVLRERNSRVETQKN
jgi:DNA (cytosine-5)-methyltransferase 1